MRSVFVIAILALVALPTASLAQSAGNRSTPLADQEPGARLDQLFAELKRASDEDVAQRVSARIRQELSRSGSATIDLLMLWAQRAIDEDRHDAALDFLDQVVVLAPSHAEGWSRRASLHHIMNDRRKAMADIARALQIEPRHIGALGGMAAMLRDAGRKQAALEAYERLLDVYPMMRSAQSELGRLADDLAGQGI